MLSHSLEQNAVEVRATCSHNISSSVLDISFSGT
jgi:hypothetical protein